MRLTFTKRGGKHDDLVVERDGHAAETVTCPKQGIIPHDMVHYAVESTLAHRGFLSLVADGQSANFAAVGGEGEEAVERLVETFQAEMWGGRVPAADLLATYEHACEARGHAVAPVSTAPPGPWATPHSSSSTRLCSWIRSTWSTPIRCSERSSSARAPVAVRSPVFVARNTSLRWSARKGCRRTSDWP